MTEASSQITDEVLTAYLDGVLDGPVSMQIDAALARDDALAKRLEQLDFPLDDLRDVMEPAVLGAPTSPYAQSQKEPRAPRKSVVRPFLRKIAVPTALAACFLAGLVVSPLLAPKGPIGDEPPKWVQAVASYQALYVTETLDHVTQDTAVTVGILADAEINFNVALAPAVELEDLNFKRAQMLGWNGKPLLQLAYLDSDGTPMALCLTPVGADDSEPKTSTSHNLAGVSWVKDGIGYYLVGGQDLGRVETLSHRVLTSL
jgi:anti-sigma factor RsiW